MSEQIEQDYTGLGALAWEGYASDPNPAIHTDKPMWLHAATEVGDPILDVGCATGRILIPLQEAGYDVDGIDPSEDALALCRNKLAERGLRATLLCQTMQSLEMPRQYRLIIVPCGTIQIVLGRDEQREALRRLWDHLLPNGILLLTLFNYGEGYAQSEMGHWKIRSRRLQPDGTELEKSAIIYSSNILEQTLHQQVRYRLYRGEEVIAEQVCEADERWYYVPEMTLMLERAGFVLERITGNYSDAPAKQEDTVFTFWARKPNA